MGVGGCPITVAQWQSTGGSSQRYPGFDSHQPFHLETSIMLIPIRVIIRSSLVNISMVEILLSYHNYI